MREDAASDWHCTREKSVGVKQEKCLRPCKDEGDVVVFIKVQVRGGGWNRPCDELWASKEATR